MRLRRRRRDESAERDEAVIRDAEESLVAALQESDTAVEALHDAEVDARAAGGSRRWRFGVAGALLAALGFVVARRRS
jgi:hypothetical protein